MTAIKTGAHKPAGNQRRRTPQVKSSILVQSRSKAPQQTHLIKIRYGSSHDMDLFINVVSMATPMQLVDAEREGVAGQFFKDISKRMDIPAARMFTMLGVPKATAEKKVAEGEVIKGTAGRAALGLAKLLGIAKAIVANSTAPEAKNFDSAKWLGQWMGRPQPALGGRKPADLIDTSAGVDVVARLLGSIQSGAYQ
jgi:putative toxin-antitoxin system antitoxin component (TIGR02293 family)